MPWLQIHLVTGKEQAPLVELLFENLGALSVTLGDAADEPLLEPKPGELPLWQETVVTGLFEVERDAEALRLQIEGTLRPGAIRGLRLERLEDQAWERAWLDQFRPMRFGERLWICPTGQPRPDDPGAVVVDLDPGLAFGTGTHPTTALCLRWLDRADLVGRRVIDFGCGSGVLAIAALKLGAGEAIGIDHDPQALLATRDNAAKNRVADRLRVYGSNDAPDDRAEVLLANILAGTLIELAPLITERVLPGGELILSGILADQATAVSAAYEPAFDMAEPELLEGWVLLAGRRRPV